MTQQSLRKVMPGVTYRFISRQAAVSAMGPAAVAQTINPGQILDRYQQLIWQDRDGLPANGVGAIAQTPDGYLWLGTAEGVVRFDGVRFTTFNRTTAPAIRNNNIHSLLVDRSGALWIGSHGGGITRYQAGRFTNVSTSEDGAATEVVDCIRAVAAGGDYVSPAMSSYLLRPHRTAPSGHPAAGIESLTPAERRVLALLAELKTTRQIAAELGISRRTVDNHRAHICTKLDLQGPHALTKYAIEHK